MANASAGAITAVSSRNPRSSCDLDEGGGVELMHRTVAVLLLRNLDVDQTSCRAMTVVS